MEKIKKYITVIINYVIRVRTSISTSTDILKDIGIEIKGWQRFANCIDSLLQVSYSQVAIASQNNQVTGQRDQKVGWFSLNKSGGRRERRFRFVSSEKQRSGSIAGGNRGRCPFNCRIKTERTKCTNVLGAICDLKRSLSEAERKVLHHNYKIYPSVILSSVEKRILLNPKVKYKFIRQNLL